MVLCLKLFKERDSARESLDFDRDRGASSFGSGSGGRRMTRKRKSEKIMTTRMKIDSVLESTSVTVGGDVAILLAAGSFC